jgi:succinate dehydrogenase/fumarate reductase cytochrome b subunit
MLNTKSAPKPGESTWLWLIKIVSGLFIVIILLIHFIANHAWVEGGLLKFEDVVNYYRNYPIVPIMEGFFLVFVVSHSLIGMRSIFLDLNPSQSATRILDVILIAIGIVSVVYGIWLILAVLNYPIA